MCPQHRFRSVWTVTQSDWSLHWSQGCKVSSWSDCVDAQTVLRLRGAHVRGSVFSRPGTFNLYAKNRCSRMENVPYNSFTFINLMVHVLRHEKRVMLDICGQWKPRSACASTLSDKNFRCHFASIYWPRVNTSGQTLQLHRMICAFPANKQRRNNVAPTSRDVGARCYNVDVVATLLRRVCTGLGLAIILSRRNSTWQGGNK